MTRLETAQAEVSRLRAVLSRIAWLKPNAEGNESAAMLAKSTLKRTEPTPAPMTMTPNAGPLDEVDEDELDFPDPENT